MSYLRMSHVYKDFNKLKLIKYGENPTVKRSVCDKMTTCVHRYIYNNYFEVYY